MQASIREFGFKIPILVRSNGEIVDGDLRLKAAKKEGIPEADLLKVEEAKKGQRFISCATEIAGQ